MGLDNLISVVWAARLLSHLQKALVYAQPGIVNSDYEGEIRQGGDTVRINMIGTVTIGDYTKNTDISSPETLTDADLTLVIDQSKYFNYQIDDVDQAQASVGFMEDAMQQAAYKLADTADQYVAGLHSGCATNNKIGLGGTIGTTAETFAASTTAYDRLVDLAVALDTANVPRAQRWVIVPPWYHGLLLKDDRFVDGATPIADTRLTNGIVGGAAGFSVAMSNNVANTGGSLYKIMAGYPGAITFANQLRKVELFRMEKRFAGGVKGLHLYGSKLIRPTGIAVLTGNNPTA